MSCEFQLIASVEGISELIDVEKPDYADVESDNSRKFLQGFQIAISQSGEIIVFARGNWLLVCELKSNSSVTSGTKIKYFPKWHGHISCTLGEEITSIICLSVFSQGQSTHWSADRICIVLGFSSGSIRFYTEEMQELAYSVLHEEKIIDIKCSHSVPTQEMKPQKHENSDIFVVYKTVFCIVNKSQLCQALRNKKNQLANEKNIDSESYLALDFKKYSFVNQEEVNDACFISQAQLSSLSSFDYLVGVSLAGGFSSNFRTSPHKTSLIITTGRKPFVGFHYTLEGASSLVLTDVVSKVKNCATAALPNWFGFGNKKVSHLDKPKAVSQDYAERLSCRFGLCDLWRQGKSIILSSDSAFSAVTDSLGRVTLIDNNSGVAQRMWKGFRDAQCGFLQVQEDVKTVPREKGSLGKPKQRYALFIVIYAPKKGLIEIFSVQHGRRVGSFKVTKFGRLLYIPGASNTTASVGDLSFSQSQVIFVSEEGLNEISVPFHCALAENSKIFRDLHMLKKIKSLLKMENCDNSTLLDEIKKCAVEFKTDEIRLQTIESMLTYRNITLEAFQVVLKTFLEALQNKERAEPPPKKITVFSEATFNLLLFYEFLTNSCELSTSSEPKTSAKLESLPEQLRLSQNELDKMLKIILQIIEIEKIKRHSTKVNFKEKESAKLVRFLACFDFETFLNSLDKIETQDEKRNVRCFLSVNWSEKEQNLAYLGEVIFKALCSSGSSSSFDQWKKNVEKCFLNPKDLALCLLSHWCSKNVTDDIINEVMRFIEIFKEICLLEGAEAVAVEYNSESPWWKKLRSFLAGNAFTIRGFFAALCCRSVTIFLEQERELSFKCEKKLLSKTNENICINETLLLNNDWETISKDSCQWDILIMQLQDLALLNAVLSLTFTTESQLPKVPFDFDHQCLSSIQASGTGRVSELVAKWLVQFGFEPSALIDSTDAEFQTNWDGKEVEKGGADLASEIERTNEMRNHCEESKLVLNYLAILKSRFPYSLTSSSLIGNMCWEYFAHWSKNASNIKHLECAVRYLEVIPFNRLKYGLCYLSWTTYLEQKVETLAKIINRIGKVPMDKLCLQETGLWREQVSLFLKLISDVLVMMLQANVDDKPDFGSNREVFWQSSSVPTTSSLVCFALSQPVIDSKLFLFPLQITYSLLMMSGLNLALKQPKLFTCLFDDLEHIDFTLGGFTQLKSHHRDVKCLRSRIEFLKKCLSAAVQTVELVESIPPISSHESSEFVPTTKLNVEEYKKWVHLCFELADMWKVPHDHLRRHQICELYSCGFDRLAEEVIPSVSDTASLASQLLVIGGKRLNYLIQDSNELSKKLAELSVNLSEWLLTIDLENFTYQGSIDDIGVLMRFIAKCLPEDNSEHLLAMQALDSLLFLKF